MCCLVSDVLLAFSKVLYGVVSACFGLPYALAFAAGAMIFVVVEELVPEAHRGKNGDIATMGVMIGFTIMMMLDVALG